MLCADDRPALLQNHQFHQVSPKFILSILFATFLKSNSTRCFSGQNPRNDVLRQWRITCATQAMWSKTKTTWLRSRFTVHPVSVPNFSGCHAVHPWWCCEASSQEHAANDRLFTSIHVPYNQADAPSCQVPDEAFSRCTAACANTARARLLPLASAYLIWTPLVGLPFRLSARTMQALLRIYTSDTSRDTRNTSSVELCIA